MKRYEVRKEMLDLGKRCDWYNHENAAEIKRNGIPNRYGFGKYFGYGFFVESVESVYDEMRDLNPVYDVVKVLAGPFATREEAKAAAVEFAA